MEEEQVLAREVIDSNSETQMQQYAENSNLAPYNFTGDTPDGLETWMAPNMLFKSNLVVDKEIEQYLSPIIGSLCTIQKESTLSQDDYEVPSFLEADMSKPVFPFTLQKLSRGIHIGRVFRWKSPNSFSGNFTTHISEGRMNFNL